MRCSYRLPLFVIASVLLIGGMALAQEGPPDRANRPEIEDIRTRGSLAVREWVATRTAADRSRRPAVRKELDACIELAVTLHGEGAPEVVALALAEAEERLNSAKARRVDMPGRARALANLGAAHYHMSGDVVAAGRLWRQALVEDPSDDVALEGVARLQRDEELDLHKEIENKRIREIQEALESMPRSGPPVRSPVEGIKPQPQP